MKFKIKIEKEVVATTLKVRGKIRCSCSYTLTDDQGLEIIEVGDDYIPRWLSDAMARGGDGEHLFFDIDLATGQIKNWQKPTDREVESWVKELQGG